MRLTNRRITVANSPTIHLTARRSRTLSHPAWQFGREALFTINGHYSCARLQAPIAVPSPFPIVSRIRLLLRRTGVIHVVTAVITAKGEHEMTTDH